jgi:pre-rRNA-processing protein TSR1
MPNHHHRSGGLHQVNKKNKRTKSSKRSATRIAGGKVEGKRVAFKHRLAAHTKADRRHIQHQKRDAKRQELVRRKRGIGNGPAPPKIVGIISLGESEETEEKLRSLILGEADEVFRTQGDNVHSTITAKYNAHKKDGNLTVLTNNTAFRSQYASQNSDDAAVLAALDLCRVCDVVMFVIDGDESKTAEDFIGMNVGGDDKSHATNKTSSTGQDWDHLISERGDRILGAIKGQGIPRAVTVYARTEKDLLELGEDHMTTQSAKSLHRANIKRKTDLKKYISRFATTELGVDNDKVNEVNMRETENRMEADGTVDPEEHSKRILAAALVRSLCTMAASPAKWVANMPRAYIMSDNCNYDPASSELHLTGYVRGPVPFDVNSLVHIPNLGTYACKCITDASKPGLRAKNKGGGMASEKSAIESDPMKRESLERFAAPDALDGEQNLVGFDEADEDEDLEQEADEGDGEKFLRPAGWSDYQSAWLDVMDNDGTDADDFDHGELAKELNKKSSASVAPDAMDLDDDDRVSDEERQALVEQRRKDQQDHQEFPDEVQVGEDHKARDRFARYRSLKSFRNSYWDPKENLPDTYAAIYNFSSFKATQRSVMAEMKDVAKEARSNTDLGLWGKTLAEDSTMKDGSDEDGEELLEGFVPFGSYITLTVEGVSKEDFATLPSDALLSCVGLLPHENKVSVLHMGLSHATSNNDSSEVPVKSKDVLTFRCGWRTWTGRPIFSQNNLNCDKHKYERFMPQAGGFFAASVFGPVTYTPSPILVFRQRDGRNELVATGSMIGPDADRTIVKRIILTGFPVRVHKRFATVKYMFSDPEDVKWFQPAGLTTKHGLNGTIEASVGEHGTMKCLFNAPIKQHDTVCLALYKRVYPKFVENKGVGDEDGTVRSIRRKNIIVVK